MNKPFLREFTGGGTHEQNPNGGIPVGVDNEGNQNLVEQGETMADNYIFSDRLKPEKPEDLVKFNLPSSFVGMTYATISKKLNAELKEKPNDPIVKAEVSITLENLKKSQESVKARQKQDKYNKATSLFDALGIDKQKQNEYLSKFAPESIDEPEQGQEVGEMNPQDTDAMQAEQIQQAQAQQQAPNMFALGGPIKDDDLLRSLYRIEANRGNKQDSLNVSNARKLNGLSSTGEFDDRDINDMISTFEASKNNFGESGLSRVLNVAGDVAIAPSAVYGKAADAIGSKVTGRSDFDIAETLTPSAVSNVVDPSKLGYWIRLGATLGAGYLGYRRFAKKHYKSKSGVIDPNAQDYEDPSLGESMFPMTSRIIKGTFKKDRSSQFHSYSFDPPIVKLSRMIGKGVAKTFDAVRGTLGLALGLSVEGNPFNMAISGGNHIMRRPRSIDVSTAESNIAEVYQDYKKGVISKEKMADKVNMIVHGIKDKSTKFDTQSYINTLEANYNALSAQQGNMPYIGPTGPLPSQAPQPAPTPAPQPQPRNKKKKNKHAEGGPLELLRFAPAVFDGIKNVQNIFGANKPDYSDQDYLSRLASNLPRQQYVSPYQRILYRPVDTTTAQNNLLNASNSALRTITSMAGNNGALGLAGLISGANNYYGKMAEMGLATDAANYDRLNKVISTNNEMLANVDRINSGIFAQNSALDQFNYKSQAEIMADRQSIANASMASRMGTRNAFLSDLYNLGHEQWLARHKALQNGYDIDGNKVRRSNT